MNPVFVTVDVAEDESAADEDPDNVDLLVDDEDLVAVEKDDGVTEGLIAKVPRTQE
jgi:hypothetical protein